MLCDAHIHFIPQELSVHTSFYKGVWTDKDKLYEFLDAYDIHKALLTYPSTDAYLKLGSHKEVCRIYNQALSKVLDDNPRIIGAGLIDIDDADTFPQQVDAFKQKNVKAISLASSYEGRFLVKELIPLFESAQKASLPIFVHPQTINPIGFERIKDPLLMPVLEYSFDSSMFLGLLMMEGILEDFSGTFIFPSLGGVVPFLKDRFDRVYTMLRARNIVKDLGRLPSDILRNVYVDTSGASSAHIRMAIELFGEDKILWGSDYPVCGDVKMSLSIFDELGDEVKEKITSVNFKKLFSVQ